jgi:hypothetical protein
MATKTTPAKAGKTKTTRAKKPGAVKAITKAIDVAGEQLDLLSKSRAQAAAVESKQPRFALTQRQAANLFNQIYGVAKEAIFNEPPYAADSTRLDTWLSKVVKKEPYLLGILQSVVSIDKNRGWTLVGGKIQVKKFVTVLHNFQTAPDLFGWRTGLSVSSQSFYQSNLGAVVEIGRSQVNGPMAALYTVDSTKCSLTGKVETPLKYKNGPNDKQFWEPTDYFRVTSFPSPTEAMNGLGMCAVYRCIELAKLLVSVFEHDKEALGSKAPKGILTINGISLTQWLQSLEEFTEELKTLEREYYSGVQVLAQEGDPEIKVGLTSLSNLPEQFDHRQFTDMIIYGYALAFGYDPREFWPVSSGALGTATETESQFRRASSKGGLDFVLGFQERLQDELPETVDFEFEQRDVQGDISEADFQQKKLDIIEGMYTSVNSQQENLITRPEARQLMVDAKLIPDDWTIEEEDVQVTDTDDMGPLVEKQRVQKALAKFPDEDIVVYNSRTGTYRTIRRAGEKKLLISMGARPKAVKKKVNIQEQARAFAGQDYETIRAEYYDVVYSTVLEYLESSDRSTAYKAQMNRNVVDAFTPTVEIGYEDGGSELPLDDDVNDWLNAAQTSELVNVSSLFVSLKLLRDAGETDAEAEAADRAEGYTATLDGIYNKAVLFGAGNKMLTFEGDDGEHSCDSCINLKGQRHKASWWIAHDYVPPTGSGLDCAAGGRCLHFLEDDEGNQVTV